MDAKVNVIVLLLLNLGLFVRHAEFQAATSVPKNLLHCYDRNFANQMIYPPLNIQTLIEIVRKLEFNQHSLVNIRILATSLLHSLRLDGIERSQSGVQTEYVIPYGVTGKQYHKFNLLVKYFTFGDSLQFHNETLTRQEICALHFMTSNTLNKWQRGDESTTCQVRSMAIREGSGGVLQNSRQVSECPIEKGVVKTRWGTVSPGHVIAGIATAFQEVNVTFSEVIEDLENDYNITNTFTPKTGKAELNNVNVATIVGDLAEVVLNQAYSTPKFGDIGRWNDTIFPRALYLNREQWDMTTAEMLGGLDGLILASKIKEWTNILSSTRLSQIIDMYYSERGIGYDQTYRACEREAKVSNLFGGIDFVTQTSATAKLLQEIGSFDRLLDEKGIEDYANIVVNSYHIQAESIASHYDACYQGGDNITNLEIITILDGSWQIYEAMRIISYLTELADVSHYGSRMGVINGENGQWLANVTSDVIQLFGSLGNATSWPTRLQLSRSLLTVISYYQNKTQPDCFSKTLRPTGHVVLVLANTAVITELDARQTQMSLQTLKASHPDVQIIYVASENNAQHYLNFANNIYGNDLVIQSTNDIQTFVNKVSEKLNTVPANLMNFYCNNSYVEVEDYITPHVDTLYEVHAEFLRRTDITIKYKGNDYGDFSICAYNANTLQNKFCKNITGFDEVSFKVRDQCSIEEVTCTVRFAVSTYNSKFKCAEMDCRYPDQARLDINTSWTTRSAAAFVLLPNAILVSLAILLSVDTRRRKITTTQLRTEDAGVLVDVELYSGLVVTLPNIAAKFRLENYSRRFCNDDRTIRFLKEVWKKNGFSCNFIWMHVLSWSCSKRNSRNSIMFWSWSQASNGPITAAIYTITSWTELWFCFASFIQTWPISASTLSMMILSVDRYLTVKNYKPAGQVVRGRALVLAVVAATWLSAALLSSLECIDKDPWRQTFLIVRVIFVHVLPACTVIACHLGVHGKLTALSLTARAKHGELPLPMPLMRRPTHVIIVAGMPGRLEDEDRNGVHKQEVEQEDIAPPPTSTLRSRRRLANSLLWVAVIFALCWFPHVICLIINEVAGETPEIIQRYCLLLGHIHSALSPLMYWTLNHQWLQHPCRFRLPGLYRSASSTNEAALGPFHPRLVRPPPIRRRSSHYLY
ncbi:hypothetical protein Trydic_g11937 [Trypoxylus dichotomus]